MCAKVKMDVLLVYEIKKIRNAATFSIPLGSDRSKSDIETMLGRTIGQFHRGAEN